MKTIKKVWICIVFLSFCIGLTGCINRTYKVQIYNFGGIVTFKAEVLAEVPHTTNASPKLDIPVPF